MLVHCLWRWTNIAPVSGGISPGEAVGEPWGDPRGDCVCCLMEGGTYDMMSS